MEIAKFKELPVLGIIRGIEPDALEPLVEVICQAGLKTIEITMNTKNASDLIRKALELAKKKLNIGAGTVVDMDSLKLALDSGAEFIVMPVLVTKIVEYCRKNNIPVFPGALTPQEIYSCWRAGADMVKVFPASCFGAEYFKEIRGPFSDMQLLACGGVTPENMKSYFESGASAVSFGSSVFRREWLLKKDFCSIGVAIKSYVSAFKILP